MLACYAPPLALRLYQMYVKQARYHLAVPFEPPGRLCPTASPDPWYPMLPHGHSSSTRQWQLCDFVLHALQVYCCEMSLEARGRGLS